MNSGPGKQYDNDNWVLLQRAKPLTWTVRSTTDCAIGRRLLTTILTGLDALGAPPVAAQVQALTTPTVSLAALLLILLGSGPERLRLVNEPLREHLTMPPSHYAPVSLCPRLGGIMRRGHSETGAQ